MRQATNTIWDRKSLKNPHQSCDKRARVQQMFAGLARSYDLANHLLSFNMDKHWRRKAVRMVQLQPQHRLLDLCCGTGAFIFEFARAAPFDISLTGLDFVEPMLARAGHKQQAQSDSGHGLHNIRNIKWLCGDAEHTPFAAGQFDCVSCAFGIRNLQNPAAALAEAYRLLKPTGQMIILEFDIPEKRPFRWCYQIYFKLVLPVIASIITGDRSGAYQYLASSVQSFGTTRLLQKALKDIGFQRIQMERFCFGAVVAFLAHK
jgi:demethylmenaquinone methyltransferase / 2-methoxy-6-polyprenyl-1,4-benzoquinol methylase